MATREEIIEDVIEILQENLDSNRDISEETDIIEDLGADSLDVVDIVKAVEEKFNITVGDSDVENLKTVKDIVDYIETEKS